MKTMTRIMLIVIFFTVTKVSAQQKTALHSNGTTTFFDGAAQFTNAYNAAINGDTIYLPGGLIGGFPFIDKKINVFGAGFNPDSTTATFQTTVGGNVLLRENADSSFFTGINFTGGISTQNNESVNYLTITRCSFGSITFNGGQTNPCSNVTLKENIIKGDVTLLNLQYSTISNNVIEGRIFYGFYNAILNNIFLNNSNFATFNSVDNSMISNNIIFKVTGTYYALHSCNNNNFSNNIFADTALTGTNTFINNFYNVAVSSVFVNQAGNAFDFMQNYHLISPSNYQGTDSTEIGIFGGLYPFKEGTLPQNPHIRTKSIATQTAPNGDLNIQIKVAAQDQ